MAIEQERASGWEPIDDDDATSPELAFALKDDRVRGIVLRPLRQQRYTFNLENRY